MTMMLAFPIITTMDDFNEDDEDDDDNDKNDDDDNDDLVLRLRCVFQPTPTT